MRARIAGVVGTGVATMLACAPAFAHHAIEGTVDTGRTLQDAMVLTKVDWINPHAWFHFTLTKPDGSIVKDVAVEWMGISGLRQAGFTSAKDFPIGRSYMVTYYPNRDGSAGGHLVSMVDRATAGPSVPPAQLPPKPNLRPPLTNASY